MKLWRVGFVKRLSKRPGVLVLGLLVLLAPTHSLPVQAEAPRVLPEGKLPPDRRLQPLKDLDGYFPLAVPESREAWQRRAEQVRRRMLVALGMWPMPTREPVRAVVHGRLEQDGYTVEKVYLQSFPNFYVTGNLYRPQGKSGRLPGVLCPHGHWSQGRFYDAGEGEVKKQIAAGAERYPDSGRSPLQARCVQLARLGCVVFHYDMIGYADCTQISFEVAHRFATQRPQMNSLENWGLFSTQAETHLQSVMGMQTFNSIRALDFLASLPDVDPQRIGVTGASGGGTQTFILCALDSRPAVAFPAVMVSTAMQGGCTCENASCLRVGTGNVEFAALFAPKPQGLTAADDWTREMDTKGFPQLRQLYELMGARDRVMLASLTQFGHNYNYPSRAAMYDWFNQHLGLGHSTPIVEPDFKRLGSDQLTVWNEQHPRPEGGEELERSVLRWWHEDAERQMAALRPKDAESWRRYRDVVGGAVDVLVGRELPAAADLEFEQTLKHEESDHVSVAGLLKNEPAEECLPIVFLHPKQWDGEVVIWLSAQGKAGLYEAGGLKPEIQRLLDSRVSVVGVDLLYQGEFLADGKPLESTPRVGNPREFAGYTFGFNHAVFARRVHDILTVVAFARSHEYEPRAIHLAALDETGPLAVAARAQARGGITRLAVDTGGFRFGRLERIHDPRFLPGGAKYGDLPGMLSLSAPDPVWLAGERELPDVVQAAYLAAGKADAVTLDSGPEGNRRQAAVRWLTGQE
ncbi:MAG: acetylxylan esterase [Pirellulaceae bacterium]|nr:acetylxylan esterase [Pirellulaceae bacterium]